MALFRWIAQAPAPVLGAWVADVVESAGLAVDPAASNAHHLYASDAPGTLLPPGRRVNVLISWRDHRREAVEVEVRSSEPMLRANTRCAAIAAVIQQQIPPASMTV